MHYLAKLLDTLSHHLQARLTAQAQVRLGILLTLLSLPLYVYLPFSGEPPVIYAMSAVAITLTGMTLVVAAENLEE